MASPPTSRTILRIAAFILLTPILLFAAIIQIDQHILRHRAEQLNADLQPLMRRPATWDDLQRIHTRWSPYIQSEGPCTQQHCDETVTLTDAFGNIYHPSHDLPNWLIWLYRDVGGNFSVIYAHLRLTNSHLRFITITPLIGTTRHGPVLTLFPTVTFGPRLFTYQGEEHEISFTDWKRGYITGFDGFCTGCIGGSISVTPFTPRSDLDRLSRIDFSCITHFIPCRAITQVLPGWTPEGDNTRDHDEQCAVPLDVRARETANILLVEVTGNTPISDAKPIRWRLKSTSSTSSRTHPTSKPVQISSCVTWTSHSIQPLSRHLPKPLHRYRSPPDLAISSSTPKNAIF
jgi:hypothetical protein